MWRSLHFLMALSLPLILSVLLMGCIKAKEEPADLGPEYSEDQIDLALSKAVHGTVLVPAVGQFTTYVATRRLETEENTLSLGALKAEVFKKDDPDPNNPDIDTFRMRITQSTRLEDGTYETVQKEDVLQLKNSSSLTAAVLNQTPTGRAAALEESDRRTYHNLVEISDTIDVPPLVKQRPGCGGIPSCKIPVKLVKYDIVDWKSKDEFRKLAIALTFSQATPYLPFGKSNSMDQFNGVLINNCVGQLAYVVGRTIFVRDCFDLADFQK